MILTGLAAVIGMAVPAHADSTDDAFLASVHAAGITYSDPDRAITAGRTVCKLADQGKQLADVVKTLQILNPGLRDDNAAKFTAIAANVYCPQALSSPGTAAPAS